MAAIGLVIGIVGAVVSLLGAHLFERDMDDGVPYANAWMFAALAAFTLMVFIAGVSFLDLVA